MNEIRSIINWECVKRKTFLRLVNFEKNKEDIEGKLYVKILDLAVLIYCDCEEWGFDGFYVSKKQLRMWNLNPKDILQAALENTYCKNNTVVTSIMSLLSPETGTVAQGGMNITNTGAAMMVITNKSLSFGAAMLLNIPELKELADRLDSNLYLLPSSVHEILAVCSKEYSDVSSLMNMVNEVNRDVVGPKDYLSDHVYYFDREKSKVSIAIPA